MTAQEAGITAGAQNPDALRRQANFRLAHSLTAVFTDEQRQQVAARLQAEDFIPLLQDPTEKVSLAALREFSRRPIDWADVQPKAILDFALGYYFKEQNNSTPAVNEAQKIMSGLVCEDCAEIIYRYIVDLVWGQDDGGWQRYYSVPLFGSLLGTSRGAEVLARLKIVLAPDSATVNNGLGAACYALVYAGGTPFEAEAKELLRARISVSKHWAERLLFLTPFVELASESDLDWLMQYIAEDLRALGQVDHHSFVRLSLIEILRRTELRDRDDTMAILFSQLVAKDTSGLVLLVKDVLQEIARGERGGALFNYLKSLAETAESDWHRRTALGLMALFADTPYGFRAVQILAGALVGGDQESLLTALMTLGDFGQSEQSAVALEVFLSGIERWRPSDEHSPLYQLHYFRETATSAEALRVFLTTLREERWFKLAEGHKRKVTALLVSGPLGDRLMDGLEELAVDGQVSVSRDVMQALAGCAGTPHAKRAVNLLATALASSHSVIRSAAKASLFKMADDVRLVVNLRDPRLPGGVDVPDWVQAAAEKK